MNKNFKFALKSAGITVLALGAVQAFNKISYIIAGKKSDEPDGEYYDWTYGKIYYKIRGKGRPILLIHSLYPSCCMAEWEKTADELSSKYKVYTIDMLGYGMSDKPKMTYTAFIYASLIKDFIENVITRPAMVIAANNSSASAVTAAKIYPKRISKLMLVSPNGLTDKMAVNSSKFKRILMEIPVLGTAYYNVKTSKHAVNKFINNEGFFAKEISRSDLVDEFYRNSHSEKGNARFAFASLITNYMNMDIKNYISAIGIPICIAWGEENTLNPIKNMDTLRTLLPKSRYYIFEKTKLFPHIENSVEFSNAAEDFLR